MHGRFNIVFIHIAINSYDLSEFYTRDTLDSYKVVAVFRHAYGIRLHSTVTSILHSLPREKDIEKEREKKYLHTPALQ